MLTGDNRATAERIAGALGIEALSRGAEDAVFVERGPRAVAAVRDNLARTGLEERGTVVRAVLPLR
jgi:16S rRNA (guanine966-N2)-methyltransferase